jgi:hypothetical protein
MSDSDFPRRRMTHGYRRRIAHVLLARAHGHALRPPSTPGLVPCAPART